jgi:site-specific DNA-methyltransferase (adenine-specific)
MTWTVHHGDCRELLPGFGPERFGACVTDPPYGLAFMGRHWDRPDNVAFRPDTWRLVLQSLKPGAHLLAFGGTRMFHRLMVAIEDAGFELRDTLCWLYGQGMPKSHDVSKAIDKAAGAERVVVGQGRSGATAGMQGLGASGMGGSFDITAPATPEAQQWDGYGTALAPSWEPIVLARKPLSGTVAANVLEHGTGGLNIDGCRLGDGNGGPRPEYRPNYKNRAYGKGLGGGAWDDSRGRWPPNVALDEEAAAMLDAQSGVSTSSDRPRFCSGKRQSVAKGKEYPRVGFGHSDTGGASRFFYCPKASTRERNAGLGDEQNPHPTVKPVALMRWLVRLITPPGQMVLDPFCGSGSTGIAAVLEGRAFTGLEQDAEAVRVARLRIHHRRPNPAQLADMAPPQARQRGLFEGAA